MKEGREGLDGDMDMKTEGTLSKEGADAGTLMDRGVRSRQSEVSASPTLLERREQGTKKRYDEAEKPKRVHPDGRGSWR